jgi:hypothetical protein
MEGRNDSTGYHTGWSRPDPLEGPGVGGGIGAVAGCLGGEDETVSDVPEHSREDRESPTGAGSANSRGILVVTEDYGGAEDIGEAINTARREDPARRFLRVTPGRYELTTSIDLSRGIGREANDARRGFKNGWLDLRGVQLWGKTPEEPMIDLVGSRYVRLIGGWLQGRGAVPPAVGILAGRHESARSVGNHNYYGTRIGGAFQVAGYYNVAGEENVYVGVDFGGTDTPGAIHTADNHHEVTSPHTPTFTGRSSNNGHYYLGGSRVMTRGDDQAGALVARGVRSLKVTNAFVQSSGRSGIAIDTTPYDCRNLTVDGCRFHHAGREMSHCIQLFGPNDVVQCTMTDNAFWSSDAVVDQSPSTAIVNGIRYAGNTRHREPTDVRKDSSGPPPQFRGGLIDGGFLEQTNGWTGTSLSSESPLFVERARDVILKGPNVTVNRLEGNSVLIDDGSGTIRTTGGFSVGRANLSTVVPERDGEFRRDDGSNFAPGEPAYGDTTAGVWRAFSDPTGKTVRYEN